MFRRLVMRLSFSAWARRELRVLREPIVRTGPDCLVFAVLGGVFLVVGGVIFLFSWAPRSLAYCLLLGTNFLLVARLNMERDRYRRLLRRFRKKADTRKGGIRRF